MKWSIHKEIFPRNNYTKMSPTKDKDNERNKLRYYHFMYPIFFIPVNNQYGILHLYKDNNNDISILRTVFRICWCYDRLVYISWEKKHNYTYIYMFRPTGFCTNYKTAIALFFFRNVNNSAQRAFEQCYSFFPSQD